MSADVVQPPQGLAECEQVIERGLTAFTEVGIALITIRDGKLYRGQYPTFEAYCEHRWGISRPRAYELIHATEVTRSLSAIADTPLPANEGQARALTGLPTEKAAEVMTEAAAAGKVTAASIQEARERIAPRSEPERHLHPVPQPVFADPRVVATQLLDRICLLAEAPNSQHREHAAAWARQINTSDTTLPRLDAAIHYLTLLREELAP